jgi:hypothetical protein
MAHNNGMVPRKSGRRKSVSAKAEDNSAKFQAAVGQMPLAMGTVSPEEALNM